MKALVIFRRDLRIHDNPSLEAATKLSPSSIIPVYFIDHPSTSSQIDASKNTVKRGINRTIFLLESLINLKKSLRAVGSDLLIVRGDMIANLPHLITSLGITHVFHETGSEPKHQLLDESIENVAAGLGVKVTSCMGHTLYDPFVVTKANAGKAPLTYISFQKMKVKLPNMEALVLPGIGDISALRTVKMDEESKKRKLDSDKSISGPKADFAVPLLAELGFTAEEIEANKKHGSPYRGGETVALEVMHAFIKDKKRVALFEKPKTIASEFLPASTTVLSPHLKFGTLSVRHFHEEIMKIYREMNHSNPPTSLLGQLLWREFFYCLNAVTPDFQKMKGNPVCLQIPWWCADSAVDDKNPQATANLQAWKHARTGYPWIDAIMMQLRTEGWIHHLARHSVACFLTRGDLFISWERGAEVFRELLIDHDAPMNEGNWMWLSASAFYNTYFRVYSPVAFAKTHDPSGVYIKHFLPVLKNMPLKYIHEPWKAPLDVQAGCVVGTDYPARICEHEVVSKVNIALMKDAYAAKLKGIVTVDSFYGPKAAVFQKNRPVAIAAANAKKPKVEAECE